MTATRAACPGNRRSNQARARGRGERDDQVQRGAEARRAAGHCHARHVLEQPAERQGDACGMLAGQFQRGPNARIRAAKPRPIR